MMKEQVQQKGSIIDPLYLKGQFYETTTGNMDADYKVCQLRRLLIKNAENVPRSINRVADVGCGAGTTTFMLRDMVKSVNGGEPIIDGYDVHPYVHNFSETDSVRFYEGDFCVIANEIYDMVVLFDVIEHIPNPIDFLMRASKHGKMIALHIPLDDSILCWLRNHPRRKLTNPGHLLILDMPAALNLLTMSGLRIIDFEFSPGFRSPSGQATLLSKVINPVRELIFNISPYLTQKLLAGVSVTVLALTPYGLKEKSEDCHIKKN